MVTQQPQHWGAYEILPDEQLELSAFLVGDRHGSFHLRLEHPKTAGSSLDRPRWVRREGENTLGLSAGEKRRFCRRLMFVDE